ncbi:MAG: flagellar FlbD family protein [Anaerolineae bacterium]
MRIDVIELTRLNRTKLYVNADHIRSVEARPDTVVTFTDGKRVVVVETPTQVAEKVIEFRGRILLFASTQSSGA